MHDYRRILALAELSGLEPAVVRAARLARSGQARLALLHVIAPDPALEGGYPFTGRREAARGFEQAALRRLAFLAASLDAADADLIAIHAPPHTAFAQAVADWKPDLVVCGADLGYPGGRHDLLILGRSNARVGGGLRQRLGRWLQDLQPYGA